MKEIFFQLNNYGNSVTPFSVEDLERLKSFKPNQVVRSQVYGVTKQRSLQQLRLFWGCCRSVAENTQDENWNNEDKVAMQCKVKLNFIDLNKTIVSDGKVYPHFRSIAFKNLKHIEACKFFDRAFEVMAKHLQCTVDQLLENSE